MRSQGVAPLRSCGGFYKLYGLNLGNEKLAIQGSPQNLGGSTIEQGVQSVNCPKKQKLVFIPALANR